MRVRERESVRVRSVVARSLAVSPPTALLLDGSLARPTDPFDRSNRSDRSINRSAQSIQSTQSIDLIDWIDWIDRSDRPNRPIRSIDLIAPQHHTRASRPNATRARVHTRSFVRLFVCSFERTFVRSVDHRPPQRDAARAEASRVGAMRVLEYASVQCEGVRWVGRSLTRSLDRSIHPIDRSNRSRTVTRLDLGGSCESVVRGRCEGQDPPHHAIMRQCAGPLPVLPPSSAQLKHSQQRAHCHSGDIPSKLQLPCYSASIVVDHIGGFAVGIQMRGISLFPVVP